MTLDKTTKKIRVIFFLLRRMPSESLCMVRLKAQFVRIGQYLIVIQVFEILILKYNFKILRKLILKLSK